MQRRRFLEAGSAWLIGVPARTAGAGQAAGPLRATDDTAGGGKTLAKDRLAAWLEIGPDGRVTAYTGKVDLGTGVRTALAQMVAEELDLPIDRIEMVMGDTALTVDQGQTASSVSISSNRVLRQAAACARAALVEAAARQLELPPQALRVVDGVVMTADGTRRLSYGDLVRAQPLPAALLLDPAITLKPAAGYQVVGRPVARVDIPAKVFGRFTYMHDFSLPGMLHARVLRPPGMGATLRGIDASALSALPGFVQVVRKASFVAVVCRDEWSAVKAARALRLDWVQADTLPEQARLYAYWRQLPVAKTEPPVRWGDAIQALAGAARRLAATYDFGPHTHGSIGPACAVADVRDGRCTVWSASQATHSLQTELAAVTGLPRDRVRLIYLDGSGCYGRNGHEDCSADAALVSQLAGAPVRVQWMRADEHGWDPKSPPTLIDMEGGLDADGRAVAWRSEFFLAQSTGALSDFPLLAAVHGGQQRTGYLTGSIAKNAEVLYDFPNVLTRVHRVRDQAFRTSHLRSPGRMQNTFANEAFVDEMAAAAGEDPARWRRRYLSDPRAHHVLQDVMRLARWRERPSRAGRHARGSSARGRGIAQVRYENDRTYVAMVVDVEVMLRTGAVRVTDVWCSHDCGQVINPDGVRNQIEGGIVQTISRTLVEELQFDRGHVTSLDWASYPILRFSQVPRIHVSLVDRPDEPPWGAGEMAPTLVSACISNAIFDATGARLRSVPFLPAKVLQALGERGRVAAVRAS
ncbi:molybdopterin cofactor-binding domain-containing protein [Piscinibacter sakaiensis]|uniref:Isoquinoline 1-oxidoreductase, beta subunit n=1 Tax=Piscinibacter sakaiensis TaxID=1547922 RepID=A0A0K8NUE0_PISS1|nr:molybdopterin cofactor-binding domain-containing protein [Piscinibacter sakaiensis]GAP33889.1 isoquinoline 1-oxidoreductase, beta subunit [Piscinibacter sakaiensis]